MKTFGKEFDISEYRHIASINKRLLDGEHDESMQDLMQKASETCNFPIAFVSLVLKHSVIYIAHVGLPSQFDPKKHILRCDSFCQHVVEKNKRIEFTEILHSYKMSRQVEDSSGIDSYYGFPLQLRGQTVGVFALMGYDSSEVSPQVSERMVYYGKLVEERLSVLAQEGNSTIRLLTKAVETGLQELTGALIPLLEVPQLARIVREDLSVYSDLPEQLSRLKSNLPDYGLKALDSTLSMLSTVKQLVDFFESLESSSQRVLNSLNSLISTLDWDAFDWTLNEAVATALELSFHATKVAFDVTYLPGPDDYRMAYRKGQLTSALALVLTTLSTTLEKTSAAPSFKERHVININVEERASQALIRIHVPWPTENGRHSVLACLELFLSELAETQIDIDGNDVTILWPFSGMRQ
ncbi:MAG: hypothetical protein EOP04_00385 [Proteobacteria bacterium]|nr:MAG: hypothetical protein EOP04_00385 [Pseudomonadota bacterium]